jgi:uncharacterized protein YdaU (DUF1376 family)
VKLHWYKRYPESALAGMKPLTLEERGAYNTVLDLIYFHGGDLHDDDRFIAGWCSCDVRIWKRIKVRLLALDKLHITDGKLCNSRADRELPKAISTVTSNSYAGKQSALIKAAKSEAKRRKTNGLDITGVPADGQQPFQPFLESRNYNLPVTTRATDAARAPASPDGPPRSRLPDTAKWAERLNSYRPWRSFDDPLRGKWHFSWGPTPESAGRNISIPAELLMAWRAKNASETEKLRSAA